MAKLTNSKILAAAGILLLLIVLNSFIFNFAHLSYNPLKTKGAVLIRAFSDLKTFTDFFKDKNKLSGENQRLEDEKDKLIAEIALLDEVKRENDFLRESLGLFENLDQKLKIGGVFNISFAPAGYIALLNLGSGDGVEINDIVITKEGFLVGLIREVSDKFSNIMLASDPKFEASVRVVGRDTNGIARGDLNGGLIVDLILKDDEIAEGDILVTSGNDLFPGGLAVGRVVNVASSDGEIFKKVRAEVLFNVSDLTRILIIEN